MNRLSKNYYETIFFRGIIFILFVSSFLYSSYGVSPVITDLSVVGSSRGIAVVLTADGTFEAKFLKSSKSSVKIIARNCIYGLKSFQYDQFSSDLPIEKISILDAKNGLVTEITIDLKLPVDVSIRAHCKDQQWLALLTSQGVESFRWNAADADVAIKKPVEQDHNTTVKADAGGTIQVPVKSDENRIVKQETHSVFKPLVESDKNVIDKIEQLMDVKFFCRDNVSQLTFQFSGHVDSKIRKAGDSLMILLPNIENVLQEKIFVLPVGMVYKKISFITRKTGEKQTLGVVVKLNVSANKFPINFVYSSDNTVSLYCIHDRNPRAISWSANRGLVWEYELVDLPAYEIDMKKIEERAARDADLPLVLENVFKINEPRIVKVKADVPERTNVPEKIEAAITEQPIIANAHHGTEISIIPGKLIVLAEINIRAKPSTKAVIEGTLSPGEKLEIVKKVPGWINVKINSKNGWVSNKFVADSSTVTDEQWSFIESWKRSERNPSESINSIAVPVNSDVNFDNFEIPLSSDTTKEAVRALSNSVFYNRPGRDPFIKPENVLLTGGVVPKVDRLKLVGVLIDSNEKIALFEDARNNRQPYALRENDSVEFGKVLKIFRDKVVFLITEYGISRSFTIYLSDAQTQREVRKQ